jgi:hypothetical protein
VLWRRYQRARLLRLDETHPEVVSAYQAWLADYRRTRQKRAWKTTRGGAKRK